jgi:5'(3')-deoxyribonucleotidase
MFRVALDMDSTVYDLHTPWLEWLEREHGERCPVDQIQTWDFHNQLACGVRVYDFLETPDCFERLQPFPGAIEAINEVAGWGTVRQFFVSTCRTRQGAWEKQRAVERDFPTMAKDVLVTSGAKDVIAADLLVDDGPHNLEAFPGMTCKIPYTYNKSVRSHFEMKVEEWATRYPEMVRKAMRYR